jgi:hypothetical protein
VQGERNARFEMVAELKKTLLEATRQYEKGKKESIRLMNEVTMHKRLVMYMPKSHDRSTLDGSDSKDSLKVVK